MTLVALNDVTVRYLQETGLKKCNVMEIKRSCSIQTKLKGIIFKDPVRTAL
jgi:hypothetical protein